MIIAVIDGMGGGIGGQIVQNLLPHLSSKDKIWALGTNAIATATMIKAGAHKGASGENAIRFSIRDVDLVLGPLGIIMPNAMMGEMTPLIAEIIASAKCRKILLPVSQTHIELVGVVPKPLNELIKEAIDLVFH